MKVIRRRTLLFTAFTSLFAGALAADTVSSELKSASPFVLLALDGGTMTINSATSIVGNVGNSKGVTSTPNQKVGTFTGTAYVDSGATFSDVTATFNPSGGIKCGGPTNPATGCVNDSSVDGLLDQANTDALSAAAFFGGLTANATFVGGSNVTTSQTLTGTGGLDVYDLSNLDYNGDTLTLTGTSSDLFVFRDTGGFGWSQSKMVLNGVTADQIVFYFPNPFSVSGLIEVNKDTSVFDGTILAPTGSVRYHNPATFNGRIISSSITIDSAADIAGMSSPVPESRFDGLMLIGMLGVLFWVRRRQTANQV